MKSPMPKFVLVHQADSAETHTIIEVPSLTSAKRKAWLGTDPWTLCVMVIEEDGTRWARRPGTAGWKRE